jgi:serine/threonine-protein kinase
MLAASTQLGPYEIVAPLGAGGMGEVYRARDTRLGREVAVKVLPEAFAGNPDRQARFEREARAVAALSHPNILAIHDYGAQGSVTYAVMELLEGETLRSRLSKGPLPWREAVEIGAAIADGLAAAHAKGIIHRDLKPENLFLTADSRVKILDFGLARIDGPLDPQGETGPYVPSPTSSGVVMGTAGYMSPEQVRGQPVDARCDLFSFGCVLYEMVTGKRAFQRETGAETMTAILHDEPADLTASGHLIPSELGRIIRQCLAKNTSHRLHSARDLALALRATASDPGLHHVPVARRSSWRLVGVTVALLLIGVIGVSVYLLTVSGNRAGVGTSAEETKAVESLAILPFVNAGADGSTEFLSDGTTMSLIDTLAQLDPDGLRVLSWSAVSRYKGRKSDPETIGSELKVQALLTGEVLQQGQESSVRVELVDARDNRHLWGKSYQRKLLDLQTIHEEITREVAKRLRPGLSLEQMTQVSRRYPVNREAYELYLKGRHIWSTSFSKERIQEAIGYFKQALAKEPDYALAYAGLADAYHRMGGLDHLPPAEAFPLGKEAARQALKRDDALADAHASLGFMLFEYDWAWTDAERELRRALGLNPNLGNVHHWLSHFSTARGRTEQSLEASRRYRELEPLDITAHAHLAWHYYYARDYGPAIEAAQGALVLDPNGVYPRYELMRAYDGNGNYYRAIEVGERAVTLSNGATRLAAGLAHVYAVAGQKDKARQILADLLADAKNKYVSAYGIASIYVGLGNKDKALDWLEKACEEHSTALVYVKADPIFADLHAEPRFVAILQRLGLTDKAAAKDQAIHSVAVLPFQNLGGDPKTEYLRDGVAEQIINNLSQVRRKDLIVRPFTSVGRYRGKELDIQKFGRELKVQMIVTGTLRQDGDKLYVSVSVVDVQKESQVWGKKYDDKPRDSIIDLQDVIAREVATNLRLELTNEEEKRLTKRYTEDAEAYLFYREAVYHFNNLSEQGLETSIDYCQRAIKKDPKYALAFARLGRCYIALGSMYRGPKESYPEARKHFLKAGEIEPTLADVHSGLGIIHLFLDWDWKAAQRELKQGIDLDSNMQTWNPSYYGSYLAAMGDLEGALASTRRSQEQDPLAAAPRDHLAQCYNLMGQYDRAIAEAQEALRLDPRYGLAYRSLGLAYSQQDMHEKAVEALQQGSQLTKGHVWIQGLLGYAQARAGQAAEAHGVLEELKGYAVKGRFGCAFGITRIHAALGEKDQAFEWLRKACDERDPLVIGLKVDPTMDNLRTDPRFAQVLKDMRLPP